MPTTISTQWAITHPNDTTSHPYFPKLPQQYLILIETKQLIGWNQIMFGRWTTEWAHMQDLLYPKKGELMAMKKLTEIWRIALTIWHHRCDLQHDPEGDASRTSDQQLQPKVPAIYAQRNRLDHIDQKALSQPITTTLKLPPKSQREWIQRTESFVKKGLQRAKQRIQQKNQAITSFFTPTVDQPSNDSDSTNYMTNHTINTHARENYRPP
jgi:hypothetical protein